MCVHVWSLSTPVCVYVYVCVQPPILELKHMMMKVCVPISMSLGCLGYNFSDIICRKFCKYKES